MDAGGLHDVKHMLCVMQPVSYLALTCRTRFHLGFSIQPSDQTEQKDTMIC